MNICNRLTIGGYSILAWEYGIYLIFKMRQDTIYTLSWEHITKSIKLFPHLCFSLTAQFIHWKTVQNNIKDMVVILFEP